MRKLLWSVVNEPNDAVRTWERDPPHRVAQPNFPRGRVQGRSGRQRRCPARLPRSPNGKIPMRLTETR